MLALHRPVPGRPTANADELVQLQLDLAGIGDQPTAGPGTARRTRQISPKPELI
jgi:hypothetical protein